MEDGATFVGNRLRAFVYYASFTFGTCTMATDSKTRVIVCRVVSSLWCLAIVGNQIDYVMKPWTEERIETRKQDTTTTTFEQIIRLDFWTYGAICLLGCSFPALGRKTERPTANDALRTSRSNGGLDGGSSYTAIGKTNGSFSDLARDVRRTVIVFLLIVGGLLPAVLSYNSPSVQKKTGAAYNSLFQDVCKLGIPATVDLQFVWFCWRLQDEFSTLNDRLRTAVSVRTPVTVKGRRTGETVVVAQTKNNYGYEIRRADIAYRTLADRAKTINGVYEERMLANLLCYMFNTICGLFNTISAHRTEGTPAAAVAAHLLWVVNCAGRITVVCFAASSVVDQDDRLHDSVHVARATLGDCSEMKRFARRLAYCRVKFDVCGMLTIDKTFLSSAVVGVVSYLVIVLQYNYS